LSFLPGFPPKQLSITIKISRGPENTRATNLYFHFDFGVKDEDFKNHPECCSNTATPSTIDYLLQDTSSPMSHPISIHRNSRQETLGAIDNTITDYP
jgi:hypothetical protein